MALVKLCSDPRTTAPSLPVFRGVRGPDRFLFGMICDARSRLHALRAATAAGPLAGLRGKMAELLEQTEWEWGYPDLYEPL